MKISKILIVLMSLCINSIAQPYYYTISGTFSGSIVENPSCPDFYLTFYDSTYNLIHYDTLDPYENKNYTIFSLPSGTKGKMIIDRPGFIFDPPETVFTDYIHSDQYNIDFIITDIAKPEIDFIHIPDSLIINLTDTIKFKSIDNSTFTIQNIVYYQLNNNPWKGIDTTGELYDFQTYKVPIILNEIGNYRIKILSIDIDSNMTEYTSDYFTVIDITPPKLSIESPKGGEKWKVGTIHNITWNDSDNVDIISRAIYYTYNNTNWLKIDSTSKDSGIYSWIVPNPPSTQCKIRITVYDECNNSASDTSDIFEIVDSTTPDTIPPSVSILTPVLNEKIQRNSTYNITWNASDNKSVTAISIYFSLDSIYNRIDSLNSNPKTYSWLIPNINCNTCKIKINVYDSAGNSSTAYSEIFNIQDYIPPTGSITLPEAGNVYLMSNGMFEVKFNGTDSENNIMSYKLYLSMDSGNTYDSVYAEGPWAGEQKSKFIWIPKDKASKKCLIKITILDSTGNTGTGYSGLFTIRDDIKPYIGFVEQPDNLEANKTYTIKWGSTDLVGIYKTEIYSSTDTGKTFNLLDSVIPDTMKYLWTIPNIHSNGCFLKLITYDTAKNKAEAISDTFTISLPVNIKNNNKIPKKFGVQILNKSFIICMEKTAPISISIITLNGRTIFYKSEMLSAGYHIIPKNYAQGMYILRVKRSDKTITKKVF